jgi:hypothetical protein
LTNQINTNEKPPPKMKNVYQTPIPENAGAGAAPAENSPPSARKIDYPQPSEDQVAAGAFTTELHPASGGWPIHCTPQNQNPEVK